VSLVHRPDDPTGEPSPVRPEIAAQLGRHLSATRVLVGGLVTLGLPTVRRAHQRLQHNLEIVERVIRGLQAIA
jgi:Protein of unknown function (DUF742)